MSGGARSAMSVIASISADALRDAAMDAPPASAGPAEATKSYMRQTSDSFGDLKARLLDDDDIARKTEHIMRGSTADVLPAYDKMVAKTQARLAEYVHKLSSELAKERDPKMRAKLEDNIFAVLVASQATRDKFKAERLRLKTAVKDMRDDPKLKRQARTVLSAGVKTAIAVFGVAAISYAGYHYGAKLSQSINSAKKPTPGLEGIASRDRLQTVMSAPEKSANILFETTRPASSAASTYNIMPATTKAAIISEYNKLSEVSKEVSKEVFKELGNAANQTDDDNESRFARANIVYSEVGKIAAKATNAAQAAVSDYTQVPAPRTWNGFFSGKPESKKMSKFETHKTMVLDKLSATKTSILDTLNASASSEQARSPLQVIRQTQKTDKTPPPKPDKNRRTWAEWHKEVADAANAERAERFSKEQLEYEDIIKARTEWANGTAKSGKDALDKVTGFFTKKSSPKPPKSFNGTSEDYEDAYNASKDAFKKGNSGSKGSKGTTLSASKATIPAAASAPTSSGVSVPHTQTKGDANAIIEHIKRELERKDTNTPYINRDPFGLSLSYRNKGGYRRKPQKSRKSCRSSSGNRLYARSK